MKKAIILGICCFQDVDLVCFGREDHFSQERIRNKSCLRFGKRLLRD